MNFSLNDEQKIIFLRQLALIYDSDMLSNDGLELLKSTEKDSTLKLFYSNLLDEMIIGINLSQALEKVCDCFKNYEIKLIELGEKSGNISVVLNDMADSIEKENLISQKLDSSFRQPMVLSFLTLSILIIIVSVIIPIYHDLLVSSGAKITGFMSVLNLTGVFIKTNVYYIMFFICLVFITSRLFKKSKYGTKVRKKHSIKAFLTKKIRLKASSIVFTKNLAMLLDSGIDFLDAFEILESAESNEAIKGEISKAKVKLIESYSFSQAIETFTIFPNVLQEMLLIAISTGHIVPSLKKIEQNMLISLSKDIERLTSLIEPIITILISLLVAAVLISGVLPVFRILSNII